MPVSDLQDALLIPARAVLRDRDISFVMIVGEHNLVQRRDVNLRDQQAGWVVIRDGIEETDRVITDGLQRSRVETPADPCVYSTDSKDLPPAFQLSAAQLSAAEQPSKPPSNKPIDGADASNEESR